MGTPGVTFLMQQLLMNTLSRGTPLGHQPPIPVPGSKRKKGTASKWEDASFTVEARGLTKSRFSPLSKSYGHAALPGGCRGGWELAGRDSLGSVFQLRKLLPGIKIRVPLVGKRENGYWKLHGRCVKNRFISERATHYLSAASQPFLHLGTQKIRLVWQHSVHGECCYGRGNFLGDMS